jgi:hypothetical protein
MINRVSSQIHVRPEPPRYKTVDREELEPTQYELKAKRDLELKHKLIQSKHYAEMVREMYKPTPS